MDTENSEGGEKKKKKKISTLGLLTALLLSLVACSGNQTSSSNSEISASNFIEQLQEGLSESDLPVTDMEPSTPKQDSDSEIGDYLYTGYIITDGVYAATYENLNQTELLRAHIMIDLSLATRDNLSSGSFAIINMIYYFDPSSAEEISESLNINDIQSSGISTADGANGSYKYLVTAGDMITLVYTAAQ